MDGWWKVMVQKPDRDHGSKNTSPDHTPVAPHTVAYWARHHYGISGDQGGLCWKLWNVWLQDFLCDSGIDAYLLWKCN